MSDRGVIEQRIRAACFSWLREQAARFGGVLPRALLAAGFEYQGRRITLIGPTGIWKPAVFELIPISITTTIEGPYDDAPSVDGRIIYRYRGEDPNHRDNRGLREAMRTHVPLVYFRAVERGAYVPIWPVYIESDHPDQLYCRVIPDVAFALPGAESREIFATLAAEPSGDEVRRYIDRVVRSRLHQGAFRAKVLRAYRTSCTLCALHHEELLDAAHIIPDTEERGNPIVSNGLSLCKIHHAAYDQNIIGISPDFRVHVREDVLREIDGPMLRYGLQEIEGRNLIVPVRKSDRPDRERLEERFKRFREAG